MYERKVKNIGYAVGRWPLSPKKPTIVFIHGSIGTSILWKHQIDYLAAYVNTVALDLPGHGRSSGLGMDIVEDYAAVVSDFIDAIEIPTPIPCGLSIGGAIVLQLILEQNTNFQAAILVNTGARLRVKPAILDVIEKDYQTYVDSIITLGISEKTDPKKITPIIAETAKCRSDVAYGDFKACDRFDVMERLPDITCSVLVLTAEEDKLTPPKYGLYMKEHIKNVSLFNIKDAGHLSPMEKPEELNQAILDFLNQKKLI